MTRAIATIVCADCHVPLPIHVIEHRENSAVIHWLPHDCEDIDDGS